MLYIRIDVRYLCLASIAQFATDMANVVEEMVGTREAEAAATESGGAVATESGGWWRQSPAGRRQTAMRRLVTMRRRPVGECRRSKVCIQSTSAMLKR